jgi:hypothetical protein
MGSLSSLSGRVVSSQDRGHRELNIRSMFQMPSPAAGLRAVIVEACGCLEETLHSRRSEAKEVKRHMPEASWPR